MICTTNDIRILRGAARTVCCAVLFLPKVAGVVSGHPFNISIIISALLINPAGVDEFHPLKLNTTPL